MTSHKPGPWSYTLDVGGGGESFYIYPIEATIPNTLLDPDDESENRDPEVFYAEQEANARLTAASPDLLAACMAAYAEDTGLACADQLRQAIEKALSADEFEAWWADYGGLAR
jgi:hypothetical protein